jgi:hypothetical protein
MNRHEAQNLATDLKKLKDLARAKGFCQELSEIHGRLRLGYATTTIYLEMKEAYRARKFDDSVMPTHLSEVWHPAPHLVTEFGRANLPLQPVLYCSDGPCAAIKEIGGRAGDRIAIVEMVLANKNILPHIFSLGELRARKRTRKGVMGPQLDALLERMRSMKFDMERTMLIDGFYADVFKNKGKDLYPLSAAIALDFMKPQEIDGIAYPSVEHDGCQNLALKPESALKLLAVKSVRMTRLIKSIRNTFVARNEAVSSHIHPSGIIEWNFAKAA